MKSRIESKKFARECFICGILKEMGKYQRFCSRKCKKKATQIDCFENEYKFYSPNKK